jgi:hypothetical protein
LNVFPRKAYDVSQWPFMVLFPAGFPIQKLQSRVLHLHCFDYDRFSRDDSKWPVRREVLSARVQTWVEKLRVEAWVRV